MIDSQVGTSLATEESVPAAFAIASLFRDRPWDAARHAASLGGDSDTIAAMAGAMVGASCGASAFPAAHVTILETVNPGLRTAELAAGLLAVRSQHDPSTA
jgi:ADP-ribosylglycohydrolase